MVYVNEEITFKKIIENVKDKFYNLEGKKLSEKQLANILGITPEYLATSKSRNTIQYKNIINMCLEKNWNINEIFSNKIEFVDNTICEIDFLEDTYGACGEGGESYGSVRKVKLDKQFLEALNPFGSIYNLEAIKAYGDSMEPTIMDGSIVIVDKNDANLSKPGIFVLRAEYGLLIKRLSRNLNGDVSLVSDNHSYPDSIVKANELLLIGRVIGTIKRV